MKTTFQFVAIFILIGAFSFTACGGGGGGSTPAINEEGLNLPKGVLIQIPGKVGEKPE